MIWQDFKDYARPISAISASGLVSAYLYIINNPSFFLTLAITLLQLPELLPKQPDIVLDMGDLGAGSVPWGTPSQHFKLEFFNRGDVNGELLSVRIQCAAPEYDISFSRLVAVPFPFRVESRTHCILEYNMNFVSKQGRQRPARVEITVVVDFEVSTRKGRAQRTGSFLFKAPQ